MASQAVRSAVSSPSCHSRQANSNAGPGSHALGAGVFWILDLLRFRNSSLCIDSIVKMGPKSKDKIHAIWRWLWRGQGTVIFNKFVCGLMRGVSEVVSFGASCGVWSIDS